MTESSSAEILSRGERTQVRAGVETMTKSVCFSTVLTPTLSSEEREKAFPRLWKNPRRDRRKAVGALQASSAHA
jgi:hypothetical protein